MEYVKREDPDIFCVQETKCQEADLPKVPPPRLSLEFQTYTTPENITWNPLPTRMS